MPSDHQQTKPGLSPAALPLDQAARLLSQVGGRPVTVEMLEQVLADGAPANPDGTLHLVHLAAWLVRDLADG